MVPSPPLLLSHPPFVFFSKPLKKGPGGASARAGDPICETNSTTAGRNLNSFFISRSFRDSVSANIDAAAHNASDEGVTVGQSDLEHCWGNVSVVHGDHSEVNRQTVVQTGANHRDCLARICDCVGC